MNGYGLPTCAGLLYALVAMGAATGLGLSFSVARSGLWMRGAAWALVLAAAGAGPVLTAGERGGTRMLLLCGALFLAMKTLVTAEARLSLRLVPRGGRWLAFAFLWPGMRPWSFAAPRAASRRGGGREIALGLAAVLLGLVLLLAARKLGTGGGRLVPATLLALLAIGLVIHLGAFRALAGFWRLRGAAVTPLFDAPLRSRSLEEFWARRWNLAFTEMLQVTVRRPLSAWVSARSATLACFVLSGLLHEYALSVPGRGGYGLPLLYFVLHGALVAIERRLPWGEGPGALLRRRLWTLGWVLAPLVLVFHPWALRACVLPLIE